MNQYPQMNSILFHSDDLGATVQVSRDILTQWSAGALHGFSILANGEAVKDISSALNRDSQKEARISVHLNLSEGPPCAPTEKVPLLVNENGLLRHTFGTLLVQFLTKRSQRMAFLAQVEAEWDAQIKEVKRIVSPRAVNSVDGHMHIHMLPFLFPLAARLAKENGVSQIRISREPFYICEKLDILKAFFWVNSLKHFILKWCSISAVQVCKTMQLNSLSGIIGILYTGRMSTPRILAGIKAANKKGFKDLEVVLHVGRASESELKRWHNNPGIGKFYRSPWRDLEKKNLLEARSIPSSETFHE